MLIPRLRQLLPISGLTLALLSAAPGITLIEAQTRPTRTVPAGTAPAAAQQQKPVILVDLGHGQTFFRADGNDTPVQAMYRGITNYLGAELRVTTEPLTKELLKDVQTLLIFAPLEPIEPAEAAAVAEFVKQGGGMMIGTDEDRRQSLEKTRANDLIAPFNMKFTGDTPVVHNRGAAAPAGRIHPGLREVPYSGGRAVEGGTPFSFILEPDGTPSKMAHASWTEVPGGGRVIAMGEMMAPLLLGEVSAARLGGAIRPNEFGPYWGKDSREFMIEIISWLTYRMR
jgi:hypothetical protein